jgi:tetratricopeptide (TPR) repeat protein
LKSDPDFPRTTIQFEFRGQSLLSMDLEAPEGMALVSMKEAPESAREFHRKFEKDWQHLPALKSDKNDKWWAVPRWSLPVWRAAGLRIWAGSAYPALAMLEKDPTVLLTSASTEFLVQRVARQYPCTAAEAWDLRGQQLRQDLIAWIKGAGGPRPLLHPHLVFDTLAGLGRGDPAKPGVSTSARYLDTLKEVSDTHWPQSSGPETPCKPPEFELNAFRGVEEWLPPLGPKVHIALGAKLVHAWTNEPQAITTAHASRKDRQSEKPAATHAAAQGRRIGMSPELTEALEHYREDVFKRSGILLPEVTFTDASSELADGLQHHFRVVLLDDQDHEAKFVDARSTDREGIDRLISALDAAVSPATLAWVDAEYVGDPLTEDESRHKLLKKLLLSVPDLKLLLRAVISPPSTEAKNVPPAGVGSVRDSDWLIPSLVFWKAYYEDESAPKFSNLLPELADRLRRLQARRDALVGKPEPGAASVLIQRGVEALEAGRVDDAEKIFQKALRTGPRAEVERMFVDRYAARWQASRRARRDAACVKPTEGALDRSLRSEVEALLGAPESRRDRTTSRNLALCLLSSMPPEVPKAKAALRLKIAGQHGTPEDWPALQARWLAIQLLDQYDPLRDPSIVKDQGARFLTAAVRRVPSNEDADKAFNDLQSICLKPGPRNWCWPVRDDSTFASSKLAGLPVTRKALLTEAYFYDAVRLMAAGDHAGQMASLKRVEDIGHTYYTEYDMAVHLLRVGSMPGKAMAGARP